MHIQSAARYFQLMNVLLESIAAKLDPQDRAVVGMIQGGLRELAKRDAHTLNFLPELNMKGVEILDRMQTCLNPANERPQTRLVAAAVQEHPIRQHNLLNKAMYDVGKVLIDKCANLESQDVRARVVDLLKDAAEWDYDYSVRQRERLDLPPLQLPPKKAGEELNALNLERLIRRRFPGGDQLRIVEFSKIPGGMGKHTYRCTVQSSAGTARELIVRKDDVHPLFQFGANEVANEFYLLKAVAETGFPAPMPLLLVHDDAEFDSDFFITDRLPGTVLGTFFGPTGTIAESTLLDLAARMARLHGIEPQAFADYVDRFSMRAILDGDTESAYRIELTNWQRFMEREHLAPSPFAAYSIQWLLDNIPPNSDRPVLIHGDFNIHNVLGDNGRISAVLDWELAIFGDPAQDLAYVKPNVEKYIDWNKFMAHYYACDGRKIDESTFGYYIAFANFRPMIGSLKYMHRFDQGQTEDARVMFIDNEFLPQFMHNLLVGTRS